MFSPMGVALRDRVSVANPDTARMIAESFLEGDSIAAGSDKIVIEAFPGECYSRKGRVPRSLC